MDINAHHRFERPLADVWAMFVDPEAHVGKYAGLGHRDITVLHTESAGPDDLTISIVRTVDGEVPAVAKKFIKPTNTITTTDHWTRDADGVCRGRSTMATRGVPVSATARATLVPADDDADACVYTVDLTVELKVPLIGDRIVRALRPQILDQLRTEFAADERWLAAAERS